MSHSEGQRILNLTVVKIEGLSQHKNRKYYVKCTVGSVTGDTRTVKQEVGATDIEWNQKFSFAVDDDSKLLLRLLLSRSHRDEEYGRIELELTDIQFGQDVQYSLTKPNGSTSRSATICISIRCRWATQLEAVESIVNDTAETAQNRIPQSNKLCEASGTLSADRSVAASWGRFIEKLAFFNKIVTALSDIHPYAKAALSIVKCLTNVFVKQTKRDDKIISLVETMSDAFDLIREGEPLNEGEVNKKIFKTMALQTIECGYFIQTYIKDGFCKRAVRSLNPRIDKAIDDFKTQFKEIKSSLKSHTALDTAVQVYRMIDTVQNLNATINLNEIAYAEGMRFNLESCCLSDTRKEILEDIIEWANNTETENRVFILTGLAGSGKSSIAHSVASYFDSLSRLGSSFFCSRSNLVNSQPDKIFITIARDLADQNDQVLQKLIQAVRMNKSLCTTRSVREQFHNLIRKATDGLTMIGPLVIVIDALDECEGDDRLRRELMRILALEASTLPKAFRIFLTSRSSDTYVEEAFGMNSSVVLNGVVHRELLERVHQESTYHDIFIFIGEELSGVASGWIERYPNWQAILTNESEGLFIYASTACKFIRGNSKDRGISPIERYEQLQNVRSAGVNTGGAEPLKGVYELYTSILTNTFNPANTIVMGRFKAVLGIVVTAYTTLSTSAIEELLNEGNAGRLIISELGSLLIGWDNAKFPVQVLHASFPDYLTNRDFSSYFYIDDKYRHSHMALLCLNLMNRKLKFNVCDFKDYYVLYKSMQPRELEKRREEHISEALQYACCHWATHIVQMDPNDYGSIKKALHQFLFEGKHLMQWIEVLSILKYVDGVKTSMRTLLKWAKRVKEAETKAHSLMYDCCRFLEGFSYPISVGPLHVYLSSLPYIPADTVLYHLYSRTSGLEPIVVFGPKKNLKWSLLRSRLPMNSKIIASAFSPDGTLVACVAESGEIQVYDFATSAPRGNAMQLKMSREKMERDKQSKNNDEDWHEDGYRNRNGVRDDGKGEDDSAEDEDKQQCGEGNDEEEDENESENKHEDNGEDENDHEDKDESDDDDNGDDSLLRYVTVAVSPDCSKIAVSHPKVIEVRDMRTGARIHHEVEFGTDRLKIPIVFQSDDVVVACRGDKNNIELWRFELDSKVSTTCTFGAADRVMQVQLSPNGIYAGVSSKHSVSVWNVITKEEIAQLDVPGDDKVSALGVSSCGNYVVVAYKKRVAMWSRGSVIREKYSGVVREILMSLSTECGQFVTRGTWNHVWDMATGECDVHESKSDEARAISSNGQFLITRSGVICSVNEDEDEPDCEPINDLKPRLEQDEWLRHVIFSPNGTVVAASKKGKTVFVSDRLGEDNGAKQLLATHADVSDVRIATNGLKLASRDEHNDILVWTRVAIGANFEQLGEHKSQNIDAANNFLNKPSQWGDSEGLETSDPESVASGYGESECAEQLTESSIFAYETWSEWVTTAGGKKLWWIPDGFRGWYSSQRGPKIVVYDLEIAVMFKYITDVHT